MARTIADQCADTPVANALRRPAQILSAEISADSFQETHPQKLFRECSQTAFGSGGSLNPNSSRGEVCVTHWMFILPVVGGMKPAPGTEDASPKIINRRAVQRLRKATPTPDTYRTS